MKIIVSPAQNIARINSMNLYKLLTPTVFGYVFRDEISSSGNEYIFEKNCRITKKEGMIE